MPDDGLAVELPETSVVIRARGNQVRRVCAERAVPDPTLVAVQGSLQREGVGVAIRSARKLVLRRDVVWGIRVQRPDAGSVVGRTGGEVADIGREKDAGNVGLVSYELADGDERRDISALNHAPDVDVALL